MSLRNVTVGCFLQLRLVIGQDTGKCTGMVWTSCSNPCCESARNQNVRHWLCELFGVRSRRTGHSRVISGFLYAFWTSLDIFWHLLGVECVGNCVGRHHEWRNEMLQSLQAIRRLHGFPFPDGTWLTVKSLFRIAAQQLSTAFRWRM